MLLWSGCCCRLMSHQDLQTGLTGSTGQCCQSDFPSSAVFFSFLMLFPASLSKPTHPGSHKDSLQGDGITVGPGCLSGAISLRRLIVVVSSPEACLEPAAASPVHRVYSNIIINQFQDVMLHDSQHASAESFTASPPERIHGGGCVCGAEVS